MWCANCQDDVATEISHDGQSLKCTTCGDVVKEVFAPSLHPETKSARELLKKWSEEQKQREQASEALPVTETTPASPEHTTADKDARDAVAQSPVHPEPEQPATDPLHNPDAPPNYRIDSAHQGEYMSHRSGRGGSRRLIPRAPAVSTEHIANTVTAESTNDSVERAHEPTFEFQEPAGTSTPEITVQSVRRKLRSRPGRTESIWGQLLAYAGVGVLTVGSVLVLWGYFGMIERYASTGWLLSTAGQMLLLLGVVTLVSGGMQQTKHEVSERIEYLGGRMIRIEQSTEQLLKGPYYLKTQESERVDDSNATGSAHRKPV